MPTVEINGQKVEFDKEPTEADIDEAAQQLGIRQQPQTQGSFTQAQFPETSQNRPEGNLGLSFIQKAGLRGQIAFGNISGVKTMLEQRFPNKEIKQIKDRQFSIDGIPIDPRGFSISDLPFDIIDTADEIVRLGGQIAGALIGTPEAPGVGTVVGGSIGRASGQAVVEAIGRFLGVQGAEGIGQVAKDIAREGALGALGESLGLGLRAISKPTIRFLQSIARKILRPGRVSEQMLLNFTGGMQRENVALLQKLGPRILTEENLADDALLRVGQKIQRAAINQKNLLGQAVETGKGIIRNIDKKTINITDLVNDLGKKLQSNFLLDRNFKPTTQILKTLSKDEKAIVKLFDVLKVSKNISPRKALQLRIEIDNLLKPSPTGISVFSNTQQAILGGVRGQLKQKLIEVSDDFAKANADFSAFSGIVNNLGRKLDDKSVENFLKTTFSGQHIFEESLKKLNQTLPVGQRFMTQLRKVLVARDFASTTFRGIRTGIISGLLGGVGLAAAGPAGAIGTAGVGILLSTPRFAGRAILQRQASLRTLRAILARGGQEALKVAPKTTPLILKKLLQQEQ